LTLGVAHHASGFNYSGTLDVGGHTVVLLDADSAELGRLTTLADGGRLVSVNGVALGSADVLRSSGMARVDGAVINDGLVHAQDGALSFSGAVSGYGRFAGDLRFLGGQMPGGAGVARLDFNGGNVSIASFSTLTLDIWRLAEMAAPGVADTPSEGLLYDQLTGIDTLRFDGDLVLNFGPGFTVEPGTSLQLFGFSSFVGSFAGDRITVNGLDGAEI
jgi:hypothetical protein